MPGGVSRKWRPPLALVVGGTLAGVLLLPLVGLAALPLVGPTVVVLGVVLATAVLGWLLWRLILLPVRALSVRADAVAAGQAEVPDPLPRYGTTEIGHLGRSMLAMAKTLSAREAAVRSYSDHVTHELKTPLAAIRGSVELLEDMELPDVAQGRLAAIREAEARMEHLLDAARRIAAARDPLPPGTARLADVAGDLRGAARAAEVVLEGAERALPIHPDALAVILGHLVRNAVEAGATRITIAAGRAELRVTDDGPGISPGNRDRLFDPFFTTRRETGGTGMGLAIVRAMVTAAGAEIALVDTDAGTRFVITF